MRLLPLLLSLVFVLICAARNQGPSIIFEPPSDWLRVKTASARSILLRDGSLLATFDADPADLKVHFPIYKSTDDGKSWNLIAKVFDQANHGGLRWEASFLQVKGRIGDFVDGTILLAANAVPDNHSSTNIDLYASTDGVDWKFVHTIATGGVAEADNLHHAIWEPNLVQVEDTIYCYYSDSRDPKHGQKIVHQTSKDLFHWSNVIEDVAVDEKDARPGMPTVVQMGNGKFIMTYEFYSRDNPAFPVFYKIAKHPNRFGKAQSHKLVTEKGYTPTSSPWVAWTEAGGSKGTLIVNAKSSGDLFVNYNYGRGSWKVIRSAAPAAYSRSLQIGKIPNEIMIASAGSYKGSVGNVVTFTITTLPS